MFRMRSSPHCRSCTSTGRSDNFSGGNRRRLAIFDWIVGGTVEMGNGAHACTFFRIGNRRSFLVLGRLAPRGALGNAGPKRVRHRTPVPRPGQGSTQIQRAIRPPRFCHSCAGWQPGWAWRMKARPSASSHFCCHSFSIFGATEYTAVPNSICQSIFRNAN